MDGGAEGSRTPDLLIANETLYQLSYDPIPLVISMEQNVPGASRIRSRPNFGNADAVVSRARALAGSRAR